MRKSNLLAWAFLILVMVVIVLSQGCSAEDLCPGYEGDCIVQPDGETVTCNLEPE